MKQPEGFEVEGKEDLVYKLNKSLYGLKQSSRCWNSVLDEHLKSIGFVQMESDPCVAAVWVDDIILAGKLMKRSIMLKQALQKDFKLKIWENSSIFLVNK